MTQKRKIKFRGFRIDKNGKGKVFVNGEWVKGYWVEGYYFENANGAFIIQYPYHANYIGVDILVKIIPEAVGQYTGLKDKNGKKIFEGDIVKIEDDDGNTNFSDGGIGDVVFYRGIWYVSGEIHNGLYDLERNYYVSVIGNIHDNPELLEVE